MKVTNETKRLLEKIPTLLLDLARDAIVLAEKLTKNSEALTKEIGQMEVDDELFH